MQLVLERDRTRIKLDSRLEGFVDIAGRALDAARRNELSLDPWTASNMRALGLDAPEGAAEADSERESRFD
jgi:hypothetical protein